MPIPDIDLEEPLPYMLAQAVIDRAIEEGIFVQREDGQVFCGCRKVIPIKPLLR